MKLVAQLIFLLISLNIVASPSMAQESLEIQGNQRTRSFYIEKIAKDCLEKNRVHLDTRVDANLLGQCITNSRLFSKVEVEDTATGYKIKVADKWTLIPIPFIQVGSGDERKYGLFLLESNFFGLGKTLALGGSVSNRGDLYFLYLQDKALALTNFNAGLSLKKSKTELERIFAGIDEPVDGFVENITVGALNFGYTLAFANLSLGVTRSHRQYDPLADWQHRQDVNTTLVSSILRLNWSDYFLYYDKGFRVQFIGASEIHRDDGREKTKSVSANMSLGIPMIRGQALSVKGFAGGLDEGATHDLKRLGNTVGFRGILNQTLWARRYQAVALDYLIPVKKQNYGTRVTAAFLDTGAVWNDSIDEKGNEWQAYGLGLYLFLKEVAIPGIGLEAGKNPQFKNSFVNLTLGLAI